MGKTNEKQSLRDRAQDSLKRGELADAEVLYRQLISHLEYVFGLHHVEVALAMHQLANILDQLERIDEAVELREKTSLLLLEIHKPER